jgi:hypothetical protein
MEFLGYLDKGYEYFSKGLNVLRDIILKASSYLPLPWEARTSLAIITLIVSIYLSYLIISKFTTHPFNTSNIIYLLVITWLIFTTLFYFTIGAPV